MGLSGLNLPGPDLLNGPGRNPPVYPDGRRALDLPGPGSCLQRLFNDLARAPQRFDGAEVRQGLQEGQIGRRQGIQGARQALAQTWGDYSLT